MAGRFAVCSRCKARVSGASMADGSVRAPRGWKRDQSDALVCAKCWRTAFVLRAVTIPVSGPIPEASRAEEIGGHAAIEESWRALRAALRSGWGACTRVANWAVRELAKSEPPRTGDRLGPRPHAYLYPGARSLAPELGTASVVALLHAVEGKYGKERFDAIWLCARSLPSYRYPTPLPIGGRNVTVAENAGVFSIAVPFGADDSLQRFALRLRGGHNYARALAALRHVVSGAGKIAEVVFLEQDAQASDHRAGAERRDPGGAPRRATRIMAKIVLWLPVQTRDRSGVLYVRTAKDALLTWCSVADTKGAELGDEAATVYPYNADHVRRWVAEHRSRLQRASDDLKREKRWPKAVREAQVAAREPWVEKFHRRMDSLTHEASAMIARIADGRKVATVIYDDSERRYVDSFPWHALKTKMQYKLEGLGIEFRESTTCPTDVAGATPAEPSTSGGPRLERSGSARRSRGASGSAKATRTRS